MAGYPIQDGTTPSQLASVDTDGNLRVSPRPPAFGSLGCYRIAQVSGAIAATLASTSPLFSMRWSDSARLCVVQSIKVGGMVASTVTAAVAVDLAAFVARSFTVVDSGGTAITAFSKMRTSMGPSLMGDTRIATTGTLTAGTRTLDTTPIGYLQGSIAASAALGAQIFQGLNPAPLYVRDNEDEHPIVLAQNEGIVITCPLTGPATGTFRVLVEVSWLEVAAY